MLRNALSFSTAEDRRGQRPIRTAVSHATRPCGRTTGSPTALDSRRPQESAKKTIDPASNATVLYMYVLVYADCIRGTSPERIVRREPPREGLGCGTLRPRFFPPWISVGTLVSIKGVFADHSFFYSVALSLIHQPRFRLRPLRGSSWALSFCPPEKAPIGNVRPTLSSTENPHFVLFFHNDFIGKGHAHG